MSTPFKMKGFGGFGNSPLKQKEEKKGKTRSESTGNRWVENPTKEHAMDRYESTIYSKKGEYKGAIDKQTNPKTGESTYTKYKKKRSGEVKEKNISEKRYNKIKKRRGKRYKEES